MTFAGQRRPAPVWLSKGRGPAKRAAPVRGWMRRDRSLSLSVPVSERKTIVPGKIGIRLPAIGQTAGRPQLPPRRVPIRKRKARLLAGRDSQTFRT